MAGVLRLIGLLLLVAALFASLILAWAYALTPPANDVAARTAAYARAHGAAVLAPDAVPLQMSDAIISIEDERFYQHHGLDSIGIARSVFNDVRLWCACQGGSTITQQLAKILYLDGSDYGFNKVNGMALALKIEGHVSKPQILADYLSVAPTGPTLVGMPAAACAYFGKPLGSLDLAGYAMLAGLPQAPSAYEPTAHPEAALQRRSAVLHEMLSEGFITPEQEQAARAEPYRAPKHPGC